MADKKWTKEEIREQLANNDKWLVRGLVAIYKFQTESEKASQDTHEDNGVGFNGTDAELLSSFAEQLIAGRNLTIRQIPWARKKMLKYAGQLAKIANGKIVIAGA